MNARSPYLTTAEAATYLRYRSASAIRNLVAAGRLRPAGRRERTWLFLVSELDASPGQAEGRHPPPQAARVGAVRLVPPDQPAPSAHEGGEMAELAELAEMQAPVGQANGQTTTSVRRKETE